MVDLARVTGFQWDAANARKSEDKHSVTQLEAEQVFFNAPLLLVEDAKHSQAEPRHQALGASSGGRLLHVSFTLREDATLIGVISARPMSRKERMRYAEKA